MEKNNAIKSGRLIAAHRLFHCAVGKACHQGVHFLFAADIVCAIEDILPSLLRQVGIIVHSGGIAGKSKTETDWNVVEIPQNFFPFVIEKEGEHGLSL